MRLDPSISNHSQGIPAPVCRARHAGQTHATGALHDAPGQMARRVVDLIVTATNRAPLVATVDRVRVNARAFGPGRNTQRTEAPAGGTETILRRRADLAEPDDGLVAEGGV
jgi:hypothetical protein